MKEAEFTKDEFLQMNSAADRRVYFLCPFSRAPASAREAY